MKNMNKWIAGMMAAAFALSAGASLAELADETVDESAPVVEWTGEAEIQAEEIESVEALTAQEETEAPAEASETEVAADEPDMKVSEECDEAGGEETVDIEILPDEALEALEEDGVWTITVPDADAEVRLIWTADAGGCGYAVYGARGEILLEGQTVENALTLVAGDWLDEDTVFLLWIGGEDAEGELFFRIALAESAAAEAAEIETPEDNGGTVMNRGDAEEATRDSEEWIEITVSESENEKAAETIEEAGDMEASSGTTEKTEEEAENPEESSEASENEAEGETEDAEESSETSENETEGAAEETSSGKSGKSSSKSSSKSGSKSGKSSSKSGKSSSSGKSGSSGKSSGSDKSTESGKSAAASEEAEDAELSLPKGVVSALSVGEDALSLALDGGEGLFTASLEEGVLTLTPEGEAAEWRVTVEALRMLGECGVEKAAFRVGEATHTVTIAQEEADEAADLSQEEAEEAEDTDEAALIWRINEDGVTLALAGRVYGWQAE